MKTMTAIACTLALAAAGVSRAAAPGDGGTIKEKLLAYDEAGHRYRYAILEGVIPVSHYRSSEDARVSMRQRQRIKGAPASA
jgi:hypothetical protein